MRRIFGTSACIGIGVGLGASDTDHPSACIGIGQGIGTDACAGKGSGATIDFDIYE